MILVIINPKKYWFRYAYGQSCPQTHSSVAKEQREYLEERQRKIDAGEPVAERRKTFGSSLSKTGKAELAKLRVEHEKLLEQLENGEVVSVSKLFDNLILLLCNLVLEIYVFRKIFRVN